MSNLFRDRSPYSWSFRVGRGRRVLDLPLVGWLTVIWLLLWAPRPGPTSSTASSSRSACAWPSRCPPWTSASGCTLGVLRLAAYLLFDMFSSSVEVTRQIFAKGPYHAAVVAVPLRVRSDLMLTATAVAVSNVPGGSVIEVRRSTATLFLHVLDAGNPGEIEGAQRQVWRMEELVARAFGTAEDIADAARPVPEGDLPT